MVADSKHELHELVDRLNDEDTAEALIMLRRFALPRSGSHQIPVLRRGRLLRQLDELAGDIFPPGETAEEFDATIRRWRWEGTPRRG